MQRLAVATIRPIVGAFFTTQGLTHLTPHEFFGIAFWLGFTAHLLAAEVWIIYTRRGLTVTNRSDVETAGSDRGLTARAG